jgi:hypothetical protein
MDTICTYRGNRDDMLVAYLYDAIESGERAAFQSHVAGCAACRIELEELGAVRMQLAAWAPPEPVAGWGAGERSYGASPLTRRGWGARIAEMPAWAQVAAATVLLGVAAGAANLDVRYNGEGLTVRTGWVRAAASSGPSTRGNSSPARAEVSGTATAIESAPWRADLAALERQLRSDLAAPPARLASQRDDAADAAVLRRVRALIDESEKNQQRELALRIGVMASEAQRQRMEDLRNIDRNLNAIQSNTAVDMRRLYRITDGIAVKVSQPR